MTGYAVGQLVLVATDGGKPGRVADPGTEYAGIGVALVNEKGRIDYWHPTQVRPATVAEAVAAARKFLPAWMTG